MENETAYRVVTGCIYGLFFGMIAVVMAWFFLLLYNASGKGWYVELLS